MSGFQTSDPQPEAVPIKPGAALPVIGLPGEPPNADQHEVSITVPLPAVERVMRKIKLAAGTVFRLGRQSK